MPIRKQFRQPFFKKGRYYNYEGEPAHGFWYHTVRIWLYSLLYYKHQSVNGHLLSAHEDNNIKKLTPRITWIGHSTFLIHINGKNILTDPIFGNVSPFFKRIVTPGIQLEELPRIDAVVISHNHWDHMDSWTLKKLLSAMPDVHFFIPQGDEKWFLKRKAQNVYPSQWGYQHTLPDSDITFTFLPAYHWSQRSLFDRNKSLWGSWMIESGNQSFYFGGDTAYADHFKDIQQAFPNIDIALLPIGPCEPHEWMKNTHMNAEQAGQAFIDLNAQQFIPMHWGTFNFGHDDFTMPLERVKKWWQLSDKVADKDLHPLLIGQTLEVKEKSLIIPSEKSPIVYG